MTEATRPEKRLSWHFLRRRAEWRREYWGTVQEFAALDLLYAREKLSAAGIAVDDEIVVRKRGKWDARYDVWAVPKP